MGKTVYIVKPKRLIFESFNSDWQWNYFRLETDELESLGIGDVFNGHESLVEIARQNYVSGSEWFDENRDKEPTPERRFVDRYLGGDFLILQKTSAYNRLGATYDARHNKMTTDQFRNYIGERVRHFDDWVIDEQVKKLATDKGLDKSDLAYLYMDATCGKRYAGSSQPQDSWFKTV